MDKSFTDTLKYKCISKNKIKLKNNKNLKKLILLIIIIEVFLWLFNYKKLLILF